MRENLERDIPTELRIVRPIHLPHGAGAEERDDFARPQPRRLTEMRVVAAASEVMSIGAEKWSQWQKMTRANLCCIQRKEAAALAFALSSYL